MVNVTTPLAPFPLPPSLYVTRRWLTLQPNMSSNQHLDTNVFVFADIIEKAQKPEREASPSPSPMLVQNWSYTAPLFFPPQTQPAFSFHINLRIQPISTPSLGGINCTPPVSSYNILRNLPFPSLPFLSPPFPVRLTIDFYIDFPILKSMGFWTKLLFNSIYIFNYPFYFYIINWWEQFLGI